VAAVLHLRRTAACTFCKSRALLQTRAGAPVFYFSPCQRCLLCDGNALTGRLLGLSNAWQHCRAWQQLMLVCWRRLHRQASRQCTAAGSITGRPCG
jgi:hypothetical protein